MNVMVYLLGLSEKSERVLQVSRVDEALETILGILISAENLSGQFSLPELGVDEKNINNILNSLINCL
jgi:hypothetical protein